MTYDAFMSYSHAADAKLAPVLQSALHGFARPWYRLRAMRVFRDGSSLSINANLPRSITNALDSARFLIVLASPTAAKSRWVKLESRHWLETKSIDTVLIVLSDGDIQWDAERGDFDWTKTNALPETFRGKFENEPIYLDLRWARKERRLSRDEPRFRIAVANLAATIHGKDLDAIAGEDVRRHREALRWAWGAVAVMAMLTVAAIVGGVRAVVNGQKAEARLDTALVATDALVNDFSAGFRDFSHVPTARIVPVLEKADDVLRKLASERRPPDKVVLRAGAASSMISSMYYRVGELVKARDSAEYAIALLERLNGSEPNAEIVNELIKSYFRKGDAEWRLSGRGNQAATWINRAQTSFLKGSSVVVAASPYEKYDKGVLRSWATSLSKAGDIFHHQGRFPDAMIHLEKAAEVRDFLHQSDAKNSDDRKNLADTLLTIGDVQLDDVGAYANPGTLARATELFRRALQLVEPLALGQQDNRSFARMLAATRVRIAHAYFEGGRQAAAAGNEDEARREYAKALAAYQQSEVLFANLDAEDTTDKRNWLEAAHGKVNIAKTLLALRQNAKGMVLLEGIGREIKAKQGNRKRPTAFAAWILAEVRFAEAAADERAGRSSTGYADAYALADHLVRCGRSVWFRWERMREQARDGLERIGGKRPATSDCSK